jgi:hypothetical protein
LTVVNGKNRGCEAIKNKFIFFILVDGLDVVVAQSVVTVARAIPARSAPKTMPQMSDDHRKVGFGRSLCMKRI